MALDITVIRGELREGTAIELYADLTSDLTSHLASSKKWTVFNERNIKIDEEDQSYYYEDDYYGKVYEAVDSDIIQIPKLKVGRLFCIFEYTDIFGVDRKTTKVFQVLPHYEVTEPEDIIDGATEEFSVNFPSIKNVTSSWTFLDDNTNISGGVVANKFDSHGFYPYRLILDYSDAEYLDESSINWESTPSSLLVGVSGGVFDGAGVVRDPVTLTETIDSDFLVKYRIANDINLEFNIEFGYTEDNEAPLVVTFEDISTYGIFNDDISEHKVEYVTVDFGDGDIVKRTDTGFNIEKVYNNSGEFEGTYTVNTLHTVMGSPGERVYRQSISKNFTVTVNPFFTRWIKEHTKEDLYNSSGYKDLIKAWGLQSDRLYNDLKGFTESIDIEKINDKFIESFFGTYGDFEEIAEKIGFESFTADKGDKFLYFRDYNFFDRLRTGVVSDIEKREFIDYVRDSVKRLQKKGTPSEIEKEISRFNILGFFIELWEVESKETDRTKLDEVFINGRRTNTGLAYRNVSTPLSDNVNVPIGNNLMTSYIEINSKEESASYYYSDDVETRIIDGKKYAVFVKPNHGVISFTQSTVTVAEDAESVTLTVERNGSSSGRVTAVYTTTQGTASSNIDYKSKTGRLVWEDGDSSDKQITISILKDGLYELNEKFSVVLFDPTGGAVLGSKNSTKITLTSDDPPKYGSLQFTSVFYEVDESAGVAEVSVGRYNGFDGAVSVNYNVYDDIALSGADFTPVAGTLTWADGDYQLKNIIVPIIDDDEIELEETIRLELSSPAGGATIGTRDTTVLSIKLNDFPNVGNVSFSSSSYIFLESDSVAQIQVNRVDGTLGAISVEYQTQNVSAVAGSDYVSKSGVLSWADGDSSTKTIEIPILDNTRFNDDKVFSVLLVNPTGGLELGSVPVTSVTIKDNEQRNFGILNLENTVYNVSETDGFITIPLTRTGGSDGVVSVKYTTTPITATPGVDYIGESEYISWFNKDDINKEIVLSILDDLEYEEGVDSFSVTLSDPIGGAVIGNNNSAIINITSDEIKVPGTVQFVETSITSAENNQFDILVVGETSTVNIAVERIDGFDGASSVDYTITDGTAISGVDYTAPEYSGTITWTNQDSDIKSIPINIINDGIFESSESVVITLSNAIGSSLGSNSTAILGIQDTTVGSASFVSMSYAVSEDLGVANVTVRRENGSFGELTVDYNTTDGTALAGVDYTSTSGTIVWVADDSTDQIISIPIDNDGFNEGDETFTVSLSNPSDGGSLGAITTTTVNVIDDEYANSNGAFKFETSLNTVSESVGQVEIVVQRTDGANGNVTVEYSTSPSTAVAGQDYITKTGTLQWLNGDTSDKSFFVNILDNTDPSGLSSTKSFDVNLSNATGGALIIIGSMEVKITEDDYNYGKIRFESYSYSIPEISGGVSVGVERISGYEGEVTVDYSVSLNDAISGVDFSNVYGTLTWADGISATKYINVPVLVDYIPEGDETFSLELSNVTNATLGTPSTATVTIQDSYNEKVWSFDGIDNRVEGSNINPYSSNMDYMVAMWTKPVDHGTVLTIKDPLNDYLNLFKLDYGVTSEIMLNGDINPSTISVSLSGGTYNFTSVEVVSGAVEVFNGGEGGVLESQGIDTIVSPVSASVTEVSFGADISGSGDYYGYYEGTIAWFAFYNIDGKNSSEIETLRDEIYNNGEVSTDLTSLSIQPELWYRFGNSPTDDITNTIGGLKDAIGSNDADPKNFLVSQEETKW